MSDEYTRGFREGIQAAAKVAQEAGSMESIRTRVVADGIAHRTRALLPDPAPEATTSDVLDAESSALAADLVIKPPPATPALRRALHSALQTAEPARTCTACDGTQEVRTSVASAAFPEGRLRVSPCPSCHVAPESTGPRVATTKWRALNRYVPDDFGGDEYALPPEVAPESTGARVEGNVFQKLEELSASIPTEDWAKVADANRDEELPVEARTSLREWRALNPERRAYVFSFLAFETARRGGKYQPAFVAAVSLLRALAPVDGNDGMAK